MTIFKKTPEYCLVFDKDYLPIVDGNLYQRLKDEPEVKHWGILANTHEDSLGPAPVLTVRFTITKSSDKKEEKSKDPEHKEAEKISEALFALTKHGWVWYVNIDRIKTDIASGTIKAETQLTKKHINDFLEILKKSKFDLSNLYFDNKIYQTEALNCVKFAKGFAQVVKFKNVEPESTLKLEGKKM